MRLRARRAIEVVPVSLELQRIYDGGSLPKQLSPSFRIQAVALS